MTKPKTKRTKKANPVVEILVDMNQNCTACGKPGATASGLCLKCSAAALRKLGDGRAPQPDLPAMKGRGVERPSHPKIDAAVKEIERLKDRKKVIETDIDRANAEILSEMTALGITAYVFDGKRVERTPGEEKIKISKTTTYIDGGSQ